MKLDSPGRNCPFQLRSPLLSSGIAFVLCAPSSLRVRNLSPLAKLRIGLARSAGRQQSHFLKAEDSKSGGFQYRPLAKVGRNVPDPPMECPSSRPLRRVIPYCSGKARAQPCFLCGCVGCSYPFRSIFASPSALMTQPRTSSCRRKIRRNPFAGGSSWYDSGGCERHACGGSRYAIAGPMQSARAPPGLRG